MAVVLLKGEVVETQDYLDSSPWASDERVIKLREKMEIVKVENFTTDYYNTETRSCSNELIIFLNTGDKLGEVVFEYSIGRPPHHHTLPQVRLKFRKTCGLPWRRAR